MTAIATTEQSQEYKKQEKLKTLKDLFIHEIKEIYDAEKHMLKELQGLMKESYAKELTEAIEDHIDITEIQINRVEEIFNQLHIKHKELPNEAIEGLIEDGADTLKTIISPKIKDSAIIATIQKIKHYEIACYGCLRTFASVIGMDEAADLLQATLDEEVLADQKFSQVAESYVNEEAYQA